MNYLFGTYDHRILMVGLEGAGKCSILSKLKDKETHGVLYEHECGLNSKRFYEPSRPYGIWSMGSSSFNYIRKSDCEVFSQTEAIMLVIDSSDKSSLPKAADLLATLSQSEVLSTAPLLILANKCDLGPTPSLEILSRAVLGLSSASSKRHRAFQHMIQCSAVTGKGLGFASDWLAYCLSTAAKDEQYRSPFCRLMPSLANLRVAPVHPTPHHLIGLRCMDARSHYTALKILKWGVKQPSFDLRLEIGQTCRFQHDRASLSFYCAGWNPAYVKALILVVNSSDDKGLKQAAEEVHTYTNASPSNSDISLPRVPILVWTDRHTDPVIKTVHEVAEKLGLDRLGQPWLVQPYQSDRKYASAATGEQALYRSLDWLCWAIEATATALTPTATESYPNATPSKDGTHCPDRDAGTVSTVSAGTQDEVKKTETTACALVDDNATSRQQETPLRKGGECDIFTVATPEESDLATVDDVCSDTDSFASEDDSDWAIIDL